MYETAIASEHLHSRTEARSSANLQIFPTLFSAHSSTLFAGPRPRYAGPRTQPVRRATWSFVCPPADTLVVHWLNSPRVSTPSNTVYLVLSPRTPATELTLNQAFDTSVPFHPLRKEGSSSTNFHWSEIYLLIALTTVEVAGLRHYFPGYPACRRISRCSSYLLVFTVI